MLIIGGAYEYVNRKSRENIGNSEVCCMPKTSIKIYAFKMKGEGRETAEDPVV